MSEYPSQVDLDYIENYKDFDLKKLWEHVFSIWNTTYGTIKKSRNGYATFTTGGWSGNEDIICAITNNFIVYSRTWKLSKSGGYHTFKIK